MIYLIMALFIAVGGGLGYHKFRGNQALTFTHIDVAGLPLDEIIAIGSRASGSLARRLVGAPPPVRRTPHGAEWQAQVKGSVMSFSASALPDGRGYRVGGAATRMKIAQHNVGPDHGIWGSSKALANALFRLLGIPQNAAALVRRRTRVLRAIANAGTVLEPSPAEVAAAR